MSVATKVVLTAFGGKLVSQPMDWPREKIGEDIYMMMDMEKQSFTKEREYGSILDFETTPKRARFQFSGGYAGTKDMPAVYKLVDVS